MADFRDTAVLALDDFPEPKERWYFANAQVLPSLPDVWKVAFFCEQTDRALHLSLLESEYATEPLPPYELQGQCAGALVLAGRSRARNEWRIKTSLAMVHKGAPVIVCGAKTDGIASLRKRFGPAERSFAKHHATAFVIGGNSESVFPSWVVRIGQWTVPLGGFSADGPDPASQLLVETIGDRDLGKVADLGAGWGYLCASLKGDFCAYEADKLSMECIRDNYPAGRHFWHDVLTEPIEGAFDNVVMNPPFHAGRKGDPNIGIGFIAKAAKILRPRGALYMVANRHLPYEAELKARFKSVDTLVQTNAFKVFQATKR